MGGTSQLRKPSVAGGVTVLYNGLVGRGVTGALMVLVCFVGCLETGFEVLADGDLEIVGFEGLTLGNVGLEVTSLTEFDLGLDRVALVDGTLGLGDGFLAVVGCGFFGTAAGSSKAGFVFGGLVVIVAGVTFFLLLSVPAIAFLGLF